MSSPPIQDASEVKRRGRQRLIGAIALVAILVVFVPMVLDSEPRPPRPEKALAIPSKENAPPLPAPPSPRATTDATQPSAPPATANAAQPSSPQATASAVQPSSPQATASAVQPSSPRATANAVEPSSPRATANAVEPSSPRATANAVDGPGPKSTAVLEANQVAPKAPASATPTPPPPGAAVAAAPRLEGFAVQVGAFRDEAKLSQARQRISGANIKHYTERLDQQGGLTRLRAGPFPTREAAEGALASLKRSGLDGKVVPLP